MQRYYEDSFEELHRGPGPLNGSQTWLGVSGSQTCENAKVAGAVFDESVRSSLSPKNGGAPNGLEKDRSVDKEARKKDGLLRTSHCLPPTDVQHTAGFAV